MSLARAIVIFAAGFSLLANPLQAKPRTCRLVYPERPQNAPKTAYLFDGAKSQGVSLPSMNLSEVLELPEGELTLSMTPNEIRDPKHLAPHAPSLRIPAEVGEFYIIITPDPDNQELPVKLNLVDAGEGKLKPGETLWSNKTVHRIAAKLGTTEMSVDPKGQTISKAPAANSGYYVASFTYQAEGKGASLPITEQNWWHDAQSRHLGFMVNTGDKLPKIFYYRDFREPEPVEKK